MTQEELEKKAKQYSSKYARQYYHNDKSGFTTSEEEVCKAYIAGAKEIQEENQQLKAQIEKMKCCASCKHINKRYQINDICDSCFVYDKWEPAE